MTATLAPDATLAREEAVLAKAVARVADRFGLTNAALGRVLGISEASASRLRAGSFTLPRGSKAFELGQLLARLYRGLDAILGSDEAAMASWLGSENTALGGAVPRRHIETVQGLVNTVAYVDARRARV